MRKAYAFTRAHETDDGIYSNEQGTGWVESWPPGMPHEEIYQAAMDQQSAASMAFLAGVAGDGALERAAREKARAIGQKIESEFYERSRGLYAFARNKNGSLDSTASIYPAVAWWDGTFGLKNAGAMLTRWASDEFSTDWGTRDISPKTAFYDPISYHQGSIWPLFTGWVSLAEYRAGRPLSGYAHLMQNLNLTWAQDLGSVTELLSGEFFEPLGRSSSHQMWSSAMVIAPLLRGLFGLGWDATAHTLYVNPHLPADWDRARLRNVPLGSGTVHLEFERDGGTLTVRATPHGLDSFCLAIGQTTEPCRDQRSVSISLPAVELAIPAKLPLEGAETLQVKVVNERLEDHRAVFEISAPGGSSADLPVRFNHPGVTVDGGELTNGKLHLQFPNGAGYQVSTVTFHW